MKYLYKIYRHLLCFFGIHEKYQYKGCDFFGQLCQWCPWQDATNLKNGLAGKLGDIVALDKEIHIAARCGVREEIKDENSQISREELMRVANVGNVMGGRVCACGLAWEHTGKHARIVSTLSTNELMGRCACGLECNHDGDHKQPDREKTCEHGTFLAYFCEDCDGAKITKSLDEEADKKMVHTCCRQREGKGREVECCWGCCSCLEGDKCALWGGKLV